MQKGRISTQIQQSKTVFNKETCIRIMMYHLARVLSKPSRFLPHSDRSGWDVVAIRVKLTRSEKASTQFAPGGRYAMVPDASYLHKRVCTIPLPAAGLCKISDCEEGACGPEAVESVTACGL